MKPTRNCDLAGMCLVWALLLCSSVLAISLTNAAAEQQELQLSRQHLSFQSVHRMLRDEHEPANYKSELRYKHKRDIQTLHELHKREVATATAAATWLNLSSQGLTEYDSQKNYQGQLELVTRLDVSHNQLSSLQLSNFSQLQHLNVSNNSLSVLPTISSTLITLDLSCNRLSQLSGSFFEQRMPQLKQLNLAHNQLGKTIGRQAFYNLISLQTLQLSWNNIADIDYETFLALPSLQHLDLSHNQLSGSAIRALQGIPDLVSLSIAHNPQVGAAMQEFVASWSLKELDASGTGLCQVPAALAQSVRTLKLSHNWLKSINCGDLDSYPLLQYLDLSHSRIAQVEDDALGRLELLELLFLDHNNLVRVPNDLPPSLEHLFVQHNRIMELQPQSFVGLKNLKTLDMSGNRLLYLPALPLPNLLTLNLQSAGIESVSQSIVHTLPQLRDLLLEDNPIRCSDLLGMAEWASPCRSPDLGQLTGSIDLKQRYVQLQHFNDKYCSCCGRNESEAAVESAMPPACGILSATTTQRTVPKVQKSKALLTTATATTTTATTTTTKTTTKTTTMQSNGNNIALLTAKTFGPAETTSLVQEQSQQMPTMPTATKTATAAVATATAPTTVASRTAASIPSLYHAEAAATATRAEKRKNILATSLTERETTTTATTTAAAAAAPPLRLAMPTDISNVAVVATTTRAATATASQTTTILPLLSSNIAKHEEDTKNVDKAAKSLLKQTAGKRATITTKHRDSSGQETKLVEKPMQHKHATLQLNIKDRHLIGTPLLMHQGDNLLVDAEQLLLPGTATVADAETAFGASQQQHQQPAQEATDKRQSAEEINGDTRTATHEMEMNRKLETESESDTKLHKKKPTLSIKKMTYTTYKHTAETSPPAAAATYPPAAAISPTAAVTSPQQHQHSSVNTPNAFKQELNTFAQLKAFVELKTEASKSAQLLDQRQEKQQTLTGSHPGLMLLLSCILVIVLLAGLAHVYRCELPWQRNGRTGQMRPHHQHHQRHLNESDDVRSFLHYQGSTTGSVLGSVDADPARLHAWHHSTRREAPYSSPLHNLQARELQREQQKLQFYSASLADSSTASSGSSRSSLHSPSNEDNYYIEMAPSIPMPAASPICIQSNLPMELLSSNLRRNVDRVAGDAVAATEMGGSATTLRSVSSKLMAPSSRRLNIW
ncbi:uncharacterized protein LOC6563725 [Drosophila grimshawi]|uniref:GH19190 n=1 Tax=Drosophila grimshawi TaxID=7222 RepID=B4JEV2_DROGR|nr:uncharacterized protein LOC6563725 [Drosophila grimshawi]EDV93233.1 GH19190 [Drosophila grimshawi]